jgi:hypothetical protein
MRYQQKVPAAACWFGLPSISTSISSHQSAVQDMLQQPFQLRFGSSAEAADGQRQQ